MISPDGFATAGDYKNIIAILTSWLARWAASMTGK
jgi:hypothetical protein